MDIYDHAEAYVAGRPGELIERAAIAAHLRFIGVANLTDEQTGALVTALVREGRADTTHNGA